MKNDVEQVEQAVDDNNQDPDYVPSEEEVEGGDRAEVEDGDLAEMEDGDQAEMGGGDQAEVEGGEQAKKESGDQAKKEDRGRLTKRRGATKKHLQGVSVKKTVNMTLEIKAWTIRTLDNVNIAKAIMLTVIMSVYM